MPNGNQPFVPWLQPAPWEQTFLGRLFQPRIGEAAYGRLQQQVTPYAREQLRGAGLPTRISPEQWAGIQREQPPMPPPAPAPAPAPPPVTEAPSWIGEPARVPEEKAPEGYDWVWDSATMRYVMKPRARPTPMPTELSPWQQEQIRLAEQVQGITPYQQAQMEWQQQQAMQAQAQQQAQFAYQEQQAALGAQQWQQQFGQAQMQAQRQYEMQQEQFGQQLGWQQQQAQMQQQEAERRERARLGAQPVSWLQYAGYTGETPVIQPWMQPLMQGQYQTGQQIPGWTPEGGRALPQLTTPSAQLWGRMGPTSQAQFAGYRQARTGIRPEELAFRMQAGAPPGGRTPSLRWTR